MPRLFVAIDLPESVKDRLRTLKTNVPTAKWVKPEQMHLTLRFIGADVPEEKVEPIKAALATVSGKPFDLTLAGVGRFPPSPKRAPRVLWVGLKQQPVLLRLQKEVEAALETVGFKPEDRPFNGHITLARLKTHKPTPEADRFLERHHRFDAGTFRVDQFLLYQSVLTPQGPRYTHAGIYPLEE